MSIKLNIYLLYWYVQQNQCLNIKNMLYTIYIDYHGYPMLMGPSGNCPSCQCVKTALACSYYHDFLHRGLLLTRELLHHGFIEIKLKSILRKFYGRDHDLVDRYRIFVSQTTTDVLRLSQSQSGPFLNHDSSPGL